MPDQSNIYVLLRRGGVVDLYLGKASHHYVRHIFLDQNSSLLIISPLSGKRLECTFDPQPLRNKNKK